MTLSLPSLPRLSGLFVMGTDTGVGKTAVASAIARCLAEAGRRVGVLKPVATGVETRGDRLISADAEALGEAIGAAPPERIAPLLLEGEVAPPVAARIAGRRLEHADVLRATYLALEWWSDRAEVMVVEGVGGLLCPLAEGTTVADLAIALDYPLLIVARRGLGTLNHTLLTVEVARLRGLRVAGVLLNGAEPPQNALAEGTNAAELARRLPGVAILGDLGHMQDIKALWIALRGLDWFAMAQSPRPPAGIPISPDT
jgi:dethiobiotin synthetase